MKKSLALLAAVLAACSSTPPQLLPPPFGPEGPSPIRLFFPTGLAKTSDGVLLVANGNFDHAFDAGTVVGISRKFLDKLFRQQLDCGVPPPDPNTEALCKPQIPQEEFTGVVMIGSYSGPLVLDKPGTAAYTGSRDTSTLNAVRVDPGGALGCAPGAGQGTDCRQGLIDLQPFGVDGPYSIAVGDTVIPGTAGPQDVLFVSSVIPHVETLSGGVVDTSSFVAALSMQNPSQVLFTMRAAQPFVAGGHAPGPMVFDSVRRQIYLAGCYTRTINLGAGEVGSAPCFGEVNNYLRILNVDSSSAEDIPVLIDLRGDVLSAITTQLLLDDPDPATGAPTTLWATMSSPDSLVRFELAPQPSVGPRVREIIPLPVAPADMVRIDRGSASALLAVVSEKLNAVAIVDTGIEQVVAQVGRLGDSPFTILEIPCPDDAPGAPSFAGSACLATSVFGDCRIGLIEVPKANPSLTRVRALAGSCP